MEKNLQKKLFRKYPLIFQDRKKPGSETRMCDGIACGDGWYELIADVCEQLDFIRRRTGILVTFFQVKEKASGLRIYVNIMQIVDQDKFSVKLNYREIRTIGKIVHGIVHFSQCQSYYKCEMCGKPRYGVKKHNRFDYALCDSCWKKFKKERGIVSKKKRINKR